MTKLIKGRKYVITGAANKASKKILKEFGVKLPQEVICNGTSFQVKDSTGDFGYAVSHFVFHDKNQAKIEINKNRKGFYFTVKSSNGKVLNHDFNDKASAKRGIKALEKALSNYVIVDKTIKK